MKVLFIDGEKVESFSQLCDLFAQTFDFPDYFGKNLDAIHDCLSEKTEKMGVIVVNAGSLEKALCRRAKGFFKLLRALEEEQEGFYLLIDPFEETAND